MPKEDNVSGPVLSSAINHQRYDHVPLSHLDRCPRRFIARSRFRGTWRLEMRPDKGCFSCRERHLKCVTKPGSSICTRCFEVDRQCRFGPRFRFKQISCVDAPSRGSSRVRQDLQHERDQIWVSTRRRFNWVLEDGSGLEYGIPEEEDVQAFEATSSAKPASTAGTDHPRRGAPISDILSSTPSPKPTRSHDVATIASILSSDRITDHTDVSDNSPALPNPLNLPSQSQTSAPPPANTVDFASPASIVELSRRHEECFDVTVSHSAARNFDAASAESPTSGPQHRPSLSRREAYLIQHFINRIGPWLDVCDLSGHFTHELPRRAMQKPMVLHALLALSSRHLAILSGQPEPAESSFYHGKCLRLVIEQLSGAECLFDDNLIATVVCLRVFEEIEHKTDESLHLRGTDRLIRAIPTFAHSGGLGEAACWQALRQDIYASMVTNVPPQFNLRSFEQSSVFTFRDDAACANVVILIFAKILRLAHTERERENAVEWDDLASDVETWHERRRALFQPIHSEDLDIAANRPFPLIHMISPPQVASLQYYHACQIYLLLHRPSSEPFSVFQAAKRRRTIERDVSYQIATIVGLAESNPFVENANFTAHHLLRIGGYCLTHSLQRQRVLEFLQHIEQAMGWSTSATVDLIKAQWRDLDDPRD